MRFIKNPEIIKRYKSVLLCPGARSLLALSFITRSVNIPLGTLITVVAFEISGSWIVAAAAGSLAAAASALSLWLSGMLMDRWSPRKTLLLFVPAGLLPLLFLLNMTDTTILLVSFLTGAFRPPSGTVVRTAWQRVVPQENQRLLAYGLDASLAPLAGAAGTALGGLLLILASYKGIILLLVVLATASTLLLAFHSSAKEGTSLLGASGQRGEAEPLGQRVFLVIFMVGLSWAAFVGLELLIGDLFGPDILLATAAVGWVSVAAGALLSGWAKDRSGKDSLMLASKAAGLSSLLLAPTALFLPLALPLLIVVFGISRGVISTSASTFLSIASPKERRSEALALYGSGVLAGQAIYRPLASLFLIFAPVAILIVPAALFLWTSRSLKRAP